MTINWTITEASTNMDIYASYLSTLELMRNFVSSQTNRTTAIHINQTAGHGLPRTTLTMSSENFTVSQINGIDIDYNYVTMPTLYGGEVPHCFPVGGVAANSDEKAKLLYLLPEAARSKVIERKFGALLQSGHGSVSLAALGPLVNNYGHTCDRAGLTIASLERPLTKADYCAYADTLAAGTPVKRDIQALCPAD